MVRKQLVLIRHGDDPPDDRVFTWAVRRGFEPVVKKPFAGDALGERIENLAGTVLYGGPYDVNRTDASPFLLEEQRWIGRCLDRQVPMLGLCQGAQMIALHLGARVGPVEDDLCEFGYYEIVPTAAGRAILSHPMVVCQAHVHAFTLPDGAVRLAQNAAFPNQAFRYGEVVHGFQFHPEVTIEGFRRWQGAPWAHYGKPGAQSRAEQDRLMVQHDAALAAWFYDFLDDRFLRNEQAPDAGQDKRQIC